MNSIALRNLSAQRQPTEKDILEFGARIKAEHVFESISEALDWIDAYVKGDHIKYFKDSTISDNSITLIESNPVLTMNILDDAICSIIYNSFYSNYHKNIDTPGFYRIIIDQYLPKLNAARNCIYWKKYEVVLIQLYNILCDISHVAFPNSDDINEESDFGKMAKDYYRLMYFFCDTVKPSTKYFTDMKKFYSSRIKNK